MTNPLIEKFRAAVATEKANDAALAELNIDLAIAKRAGDQEAMDVAQRAINDFNTERFKDGSAYRNLKPFFLEAVIDAGFTLEDIQAMKYRL